MISHRTVECLDCQTPNTLDSAFCRRCGKTLDPAALATAREQNRELVKAGVKALSEGRLSEAILVAQSAIAADERCIEAWMLMGEARERDRDYPSALGAYEQVLTLDPDSALTPIKIENLQQLISRDSLTVPPAPRKIALLGAVATTLLVGTAGAAIAMWPSRNADKQTPVATTKPQVQVASNGFPEGVEATLGKPTTNPTTSQAPAEQAPDATKKPATEDTPSTKAETKPDLPDPARPTTRPTSHGDDGNSPLAPPPLRVDPDKTLSATTRPTPSVGVETSTVDEDPATRPAPRVKEPTPPEKTGRPPVYDIRPSKGTNSVGGSQPLSKTEDPFRQAQEAFISGRIETAIGLYQKSLAAGGPAGRIYQRLGQCYERLGRKADAIQSYEQAIANYERAGGNSAALAACKQAVQVLRGS